MGYRINYEPVHTLQQKEQGSSRVAVMTGMLLCLFFVLVARFWPEGREVIQNIFIPGDRDTTIFAVSGLINELSSGERLHNALETFCITILEGADVALH